MSDAEYVNATRNYAAMSQKLSPLWSRALDHDMDLYRLNGFSRFMLGELFRVHTERGHYPLPNPHVNVNDQEYWVATKDAKRAGLLSEMEKTDLFIFHDWPYVKQTLAFQDPPFLHFTLGASTPLKRTRTNKSTKKYKNIYKKSKRH